MATREGLKLWNDPQFIKRRIHEQKIYLLDIEARLAMPCANVLRLIEVEKSARDILERLETHLKELARW